MHFMRTVVVLSLLLMTACVAGYRHGAQSFATKEEALAAQQAEMMENLSKITVRSTQLTKPLIAFIPTKNHIGAYGTQGNGSAEEYDFVTTHLQENLKSIPLGIEKSQLFPSVETQEIDGVARPIAPPGTHVIWMMLTSFDSGEWVYFNDSMNDTVPLLTDTTIPDRAARLDKWIDNLAEIAARHGDRLGPVSAGSAAPMSQPSQGNAAQPTSTRRNNVIRTVN